MSNLSVADETDPARDLRAELDAAAPRLSWFEGEALAQMQLRAEGKLRPVQTPWKGLNTQLGGGLWPGMHVLSGTTGSGKTQMALQLAGFAAAAGVPTLYVALELNRPELLARLISAAFAESGRRVSWSDLYQGRNPGALAEAKRDVIPMLRGLPLHVEEGAAGQWQAATLEDRFKGISDYYGKAPLIVLDYLQIVGPESDRQDLRMCIRSAALRARNVARRGATVLLLSSVSRENAKLLVPGDDQIRPGGERSDPSMLVGLGKESGEIEFTADTVLALSREEFDPAGTPMHLAIAKQRAGRPGWVSFRFDGSGFSAQQALTGASGLEEVR
jgi:replicative DNA helicase